MAQGRALGGFVSEELKVGQAKLVLDNCCPQLNERWDSAGFVSIHTNSRKDQSTSIVCLNTLRNRGYKFDIRTVDGTMLHNVDINEARVKIEFNLPPSVSTLPKNGITAWRPVVVPLSIETVPFNSSSLLKEPIPFKPYEKTVGPFYSNDKYKREIKPGVFIDVYDLIDCYEVTSGALQHALKKILAAGKRGHKDYEQDLIDILSSVERALFQHQEKNK